MSNVGAEQSGFTQVRELEECNAKLLQRATLVEGKQSSMLEQVAQISECLHAKTEENQRLQAELELLRKSIAVRILHPQVGWKTLH